MDESILTSIKKLLGITEECEDFDQDLIMHINSVFMILRQLGFHYANTEVEGKETKWSDLGLTTRNYPAIKSYIYLKVRLLFDPPSSSAVIESINRQISEFEWRLNVAYETNNR